MFECPASELSRGLDHRGGEVVVVLEEVLAYKRQEEVCDFGHIIVGQVAPPAVEVEAPGLVHEGVTPARVPPQQRVGRVGHMIHRIVVVGAVGGGWGANDV